MALFKEYSLNHTTDPYVIQAIFRLPGSFEYQKTRRPRREGPDPAAAPDRAPAPLRRLELGASPSSCKYYLHLQYVYVCSHPEVDRIWGMSGICYDSFRGHILSTPGWLHVYSYGCCICILLSAFRFTCIPIFIYLLMSIILRGCCCCYHVECSIDPVQSILFYSILTPNSQKQPYLNLYPYLQLSQKKYPHSPWRQPWLSCSMPPSAPDDDDRPPWSLRRWERRPEAPALSYVSSGQHSLQTAKYC